MIKLVALKRFRYPTGPSGRDYQPGQELTALSERDAKALRLLRVAKDVVPETPKSASASAPAPAAAAPVAAPSPPTPPPPAAPPPPMTTENTADLVETQTPRRSRYRRRDMLPEGQGSGEE